MTKPRYALATITTIDFELVKKTEEIRKNTGFTHEEIYRKGLEVIENNWNIKNNAQQ
jgi:hypothetical protein